MYSNVISSRDEKNPGILKKNPIPRILLGFLGFCPCKKYTKDQKIEILTNLKFNLKDDI